MLDGVHPFRTQLLNLPHADPEVLVQEAEVMLQLLPGELELEDVIIWVLEPEDVLEVELELEELVELELELEDGELELEDVISLVLELELDDELILDPDEEFDDE